MNEYVKEHLRKRIKELQRRDSNLVNLLNDVHKQRNATIFEIHILRKAIIEGV